MNDAPIPVPEPNRDNARLSKQEPGLRYDVDKPRFTLVDRIFLWGLIKALEYGAKKYSIDNWRRGMSWSRNYNCLQRHLDAWWGGEDLDPESGLHHLDHAASCLMFQRRYVEKGYSKFDDRPPGPGRRHDSDWWDKHLGSDQAQK
jgi:hypothetical protein